MHLIDDSERRLSAVEARVNELHDSHIRLETKIGTEIEGIRQQNKAQYEELNKKMDSMLDSITALDFLNNPTDQQSLREDFGFLHKQRLSKEETNSLVKKAGIMGFGGGVIIALWEGIKVVIAK